MEFGKAWRSLKLVAFCRVHSVAEVVRWPRTGKVSVYRGEKDKCNTAQHSSNRPKACHHCIMVHLNQHPGFVQFHSLNSIFSQVAKASEYNISIDSFLLSITFTLSPSLPAMLLSLHRIILVTSRPHRTVLTRWNKQYQNLCTLPTITV